MTNLNVVVLGPPGFSKDIGKIGTNTDIAFYNHKKGETTLTLIEPSRYPEKFSSLFFAVSLGDVAVLVIEEITAVLGECILMLDCAGIDQGYLILRNYLDKEQIAPLIKGTVLEGYEIVSDDTNLLRERLLHEAEERKSPEEGKGIIPVDHHFNVKGIGTVILGSVIAGTIHKHDQVRVYPTTITATVRSIQKHDDDAQDAVTGDRVGLALKGIDAEMLDRGYVLAPEHAVVQTTTITGSLTLIPYWKEPIREQMVLYVGHWMQFLPFRVTGCIPGENPREKSITLSSDHELMYRPGDSAVLVYLESEKLRIVGSILLA
ncbi:MAG: elongation factor Tu [Methanospirillaceae archaeon]|nr:elongation factor Tu [Methanospirillaceae archaeon]